jgi:CDP-diacylglycerol---glycerol-3-phosphate 3-phosphatidyltransferase
MMREKIWNVPNILTLSRLPLTAILCWLIAIQSWWPALIVFLIAATTDAVDGWWARKFNQGTTFGRVFDPLTDKIMLGSAFIFLVQVPDSDITAWMVALILSREMLITGVRGYLESLGMKFGADWFGKLKTILQCIWLGEVLFYLAVATTIAQTSLDEVLSIINQILLWAMFLATMGSGVQYLVKGMRLLNRENGDG